MRQWTENQDFPWLSQLWSACNHIRLLQLSDYGQLLDFCVRVNRLCGEWEDCAVGSLCQAENKCPVLSCFKVSCLTKPSNSLSLLQSSRMDWQRPRPWGTGTILMCHVFLLTHTAVQNDLSSRTLTLDCALLHDISRLLRGREVIYWLWIRCSQFSLPCNVANVGSDPHRSSFLPCWHDFLTYCAGQND